MISSIQSIPTWTCELWLRWSVASVELAILRESNNRNLCLIASPYTKWALSNVLLLVCGHALSQQRSHKRRCSVGLLLVAWKHCLQFSSRTASNSSVHIWASPNQFRNLQNTIKEHRAENQVNKMKVFLFFQDENQTTVIPMILFWVHLACHRRYKYGEYKQSEGFNERGNSPYLCFPKYKMQTTLNTLLPSDRVWNTLSVSSVPVPKLLFQGHSHFHSICCIEQESSLVKILLRQGVQIQKCCPA